MTLVLGCDFSSRPSKLKPIVFAQCTHAGDVLQLDALVPCLDMTQFASVLALPQWVGGFDLPFGLPRELIQTLGWSTQWLPAMRHYGSLSREQIRAQFKAFCDARPVGGKFAHRACDKPASSSPSMKWVNPPVAYMLHAGVPALLAAGVTLAGVHAADPRRIALEAYPAYAARAVIGNQTYKSDDTAKQTVARAQARAALIAGITHTPHPQLGLRLEASAAHLSMLQNDASGDSLDAVLCALQAAWSVDLANYGLPAQLDPLEGWIVSVPFTPAKAAVA